MHGITDDDIIRQIGLPDPIPEDAINIIHGEHVNVTIGKYFNSCTQFQSGQ